MIQIQHLSKTFNSGSSNEIRALEDINLDIKAEEFVVIVGSNGSGKSTLLQAIAGSIPIESGSVKIDGTDVTKLQEFERSKWISRIFQNPLAGTAPDLSILDNFRLAALRSQSKKLKVGIDTDFKNKVREKIAILNMGLENKLDQQMGTLSGGQRQALTLVMAIMDTAKILILDEPTAALDPKSSQTLMEKAASIIVEYKLTAILVTHALKDAHTFGNRLIQMGEGKIIHDLNAQEKKGLSLPQLFEWFV
jgi:putative ABC transport system ATP-binding protein